MANGPSCILRKSQAPQAAAASPPGCSSHMCAAARTPRAKVTLVWYCEDGCSHWLTGTGRQICCWRKRQVCAATLLCNQSMHGTSAIRLLRRCLTAALQVPTISVQFLSHRACAALMNVHMACCGAIQSCVFLSGCTCTTRTAGCQPDRSCHTSTTRSQVIQQHSQTNLSRARSAQTAQLWRSNRRLTSSLGPESSHRCTAGFVTLWQRRASTQAFRSPSITFF